MILPTAPTVLLRLLVGTVATSLVPHRSRSALARGDHEFVVRPGRRSGWRWWLEQHDGTQLAAGPRPAGSPEQARAQTLRVRLAAATSPVEFFTDDLGRHHWRLLSRSGAMLAVSAAGYLDKPAADRAVAAFRREASHAGLHDG